MISNSEFWLMVSFGYHQSHVSSSKRAEPHISTANSYGHLHKHLFGWLFDQCIAFAVENRQIINVDGKSQCIGKPTMDTITYGKSAMENNDV